MFGLFNKKQPIERDLFEGHPLGEDGFHALLANNWHRLGELYQGQTASDRYHWIQMLGMAMPLDQELPDTFPTAGCWTISGGLSICRAARVRGSGIADTVDEDAALDMFRNARAAYAALDRALELEPNDSTSFAWYFRAMTAACDHSNLKDSLLEQLHQTDETTVFAPFDLMIYSTAKWMGSREDMWHVANHYTQAPPNSAWLALNARAMIEDWLWFSAFEDDKDAKKAYSDYRYSPQYRKDITALNDAFWAGLEDDWADIPRAEIMLAHNTFGFLTYRAGLHELAAAHMERIGQHVSPMPWGYLHRSDDLMKEWNKTRKSVGLEGFYA